MKQLLFILLFILAIFTACQEKEEFVYTEFTLRARSHMDNIIQSRENTFNMLNKPLSNLPHLSQIQSLELEIYIGEGEFVRREVSFVHPPRVGNHHFMIPLSERNNSFFSDIGFTVQISIDGRNARLTRGDMFLDFSDESSTIFRNYIAVAQLLDKPVFANSTLYVPAEMFFKAIDIRTSIEDSVLLVHLHNQPLQDK